MASVYIQNKRGREEFWNGGSFGLPESKRINMGHDTDLMALLDRIDNIDYIEKNSNESALVINELEIQEENEERLNVVIKSLEDEIGLKSNENTPCIDGSDNNAADDEKKEGVDDNKSCLVEGISDTTATSMSDVGELASEGNLYYDDIRGELGYFMDHAAAASAADELGIIMSHCQSGDQSISNFYLDSLHGYADNTEVFYGSLWEDDIWQVNDHAAFFQNGSTQEEVDCSGPESHDVENDIRPRQCLSAVEEGA